MPSTFRQIYQNIVLNPKGEKKVRNSYNYNNLKLLSRICIFFLPIKYELHKLSSPIWASEFLKIFNPMKVVRNSNFILDYLPSVVNCVDCVGVGDMTLLLNSQVVTHPETCNGCKLVFQITSFFKYINFI